ncbi:NosD domain-containing protein [Candidatus Bipolaricaulota bacterium]
MKRTGFILLTLIAIAFVSLASSADVRGPIVILGNADFTAANGVVSGSGSLMDPYIIAGHEITVAAGQFYGVRIENVSAAYVLRGLYVTGAGEADGAGIRVGFASGGTIESCTITNSQNGIELLSSTDVIIRNSLIYVSARGLRVVGETAEEYRHEIDETVQVNDSPVLYYYGLDGDRIEGKQSRHLTVAGSRNVTIIGNTVTDGDGIQLAFVTDSTVTANTAGRETNVRTEHAIQLFQSDRNELTFNLIKNARLAGIQLTLSSENVVSKNYLAVNDTGIRLIASDANDISENDLVGCYTAIWLSGGSMGNSVDGNVVRGKVSDDGDRRQGIVVELAFGNVVERNAISECEMGISISAQAASNAFTNNSIFACSYGISMSGSSSQFEGNLLSLSTRGLVFPETYGNSITRGNTFLANVFSTNGSHIYTNLDSEANEFARNVLLGTTSALVADNGSDNRWTINGVGNYWADAGVLDEDGDGLGDAPVLIYPAGAQDSAPLVGVTPSELGVGILGALDRIATRIETSDGAIVALETLIANQGSARWIGFQGFPEPLLSGFPGILFVFEDESERRFHMSNVDFDLDIAFFDAAGTLVGKSLMEANSEALYTAASPFQYALELPGGMLEDLGIGEGATLEVP